MLLLNGLLHLLRKLGLVMLDPTEANFSFGLIVGNGMDPMANFGSAFAELAATKCEDADAHLPVGSNLVFRGEPSLSPFVESYFLKAVDQAHLNEWVE